MSEQRSESAAIAPAVDIDSAWWWEGLHERGQLLLPRCLSCHRCSFPPMLGCPHCGGTTFERVTASGWGRVYSWVVVHVPQHPVYDAEAPYTILAVDLAEGVRVFGRLRGGGEPADGGPVRAALYEAGGATLLGFELERA